MEPTEKKVTPHVVDFATIIPEGSCEWDSGDFRERCVSLVKMSSIRHTLKEGWDLTDDILKNLHERGMDPYSFC